ncbi:MAG: 16S rRNA processing protein RimM [Prevotella sp.]|nr:16S rRNA processing protein RimM [Prevotella sp.]
MIRQEDVYRIGRLGKPHGVKGEITFMFDDDIFDRTDCDYLILSIDGILVPFFIDEYRFKSEETALVKFEDIDTQERAAELTNTDVFFPRELSDADGTGLSWAATVGFEIIDAGSGKAVGRIASVDDSTVNTLFELEDGTLVPAQDELIRDVDTARRTIEMALPEGLLDIDKAEE